MPSISLTTGSHPDVNAAITQIPDTAWTAPPAYPNLFVEQDTGQLAWFLSRGVLD